jgi:hypothetical protein
VDGTFDQAQIAAVWAILFLTTVSFLSIARAIDRKLTPPERCLLVGDTRTAEYVREKLALSHAVKAELVGSVPADAVASNGAGAGHGNRCSGPRSGSRSPKTAAYISCGAPTPSRSSVVAITRAVAEQRASLACSVGGSAPTTLQSR